MLVVFIVVMSATKTNPLDQKNFLATLRSQQAGFLFGQPQRIEEKSLAIVLPILRSGDDPRLYITFPETDQVEVSDTGSIDAMTAQNKTDDNVFIRSGTMFTGKTQSRALQRSTVLLPHELATLPVRCIHASHGISPGSKVNYNGITPLDMDKGVYGSGYQAKDQKTYWANVHSSTVKMSAMNVSAELSPGLSAGVRSRMEHHRLSEPQPGFDNLSDNFKQFAKNFDHILAKVKREKNQAGLALITDGGVQTIEVFDHALSWQALHEAAIKRLGPDLAKTDPNEVFKVNPVNATKAVDAVLALPYQFNLLYANSPVHDEPRTEIFGMTAEKFVGEMVLMDGAVIHLVLLRPN